MQDIKNIGLVIGLFTCVQSKVHVQNNYGKSTIINLEGKNFGIQAFKSNFNGSNFAKPTKINFGEDILVISTVFEPIK